MPAGCGCRWYGAVAALSVILSSTTNGAARPGPAPAPAPQQAPTPIFDLSNTCECNPAVNATTGSCLPFNLATPWGCTVDPTNPHPEYPRPHLQRQTWMSLNGLWDWERLAGWDTSNTTFYDTYSFKIVVPYPVPSDLAGVPDPYRVGVTRMLYRRNFTIPESWASLPDETSTFLHIDRVDWEAEVWINDVHVGLHRGGYDRFTMDITTALTKSNNGVHWIVVRVYDPTESAHIVLGKQRLAPKESIFYKGVQGIWGSVWLEPVSQHGAKKLEMTPDIDSSSLQVRVLGFNSSNNVPLKLTVTSDGKEVARGEGLLGSQFNITIPSMRLWSPADPFLYDVNLEVYQGDANSTNLKKAVIDNVKSYIGLKKISLGCVDPSSPDSPIRIFLNNKPFTQFAFLDQGFWPDGIYTAPTDLALQYDLYVAKMIGATSLRKHIKVEPDRWYHHADRMGLLITQDMPSMYYENDLPGRLHPEVTIGEKRQFETEFKRMVEDHVSFTCIGQYNAFNEGWGQYDTQRIVQMGHNIDSSRLWGAASGWIDPQDRTADQLVKTYEHYTGYVGDVKDDHNYPEPASTGVTATRASIAGEYGGIGLWLDGHNSVPRSQAAGSPGNGPYADNSTVLQEEFLKHLPTLKDLITGSTGVSAAVYTQLTDVETEPNGIMSYDRKVVKFADRDAVRAAIQDLLATPVN